uniref:Uncharacterized protein n=1 Tax=mine drainage metagenome TaxID=410659 RepID=E6PQB8_9ZZZZ
MRRLIYALNSRPFLGFLEVA